MIVLELIKFMETIEFTVNGEVYTVEELEGKYEIVVQSKFVGEMYREKNKGWAWEAAEASADDHPWEEIGRKIDKHTQNLSTSV